MKFIIWNKSFGCFITSGIVSETHINKLIGNSIDDSSAVACPNTVSCRSFKPPRHQWRPKRHKKCDTHASTQVCSDQQLHLKLHFQYKSDTIRTSVFYSTVVEEKNQTGIKDHTILRTTFEILRVKANTETKTETQ